MMSLATGTRLGVYEITGLVGAGGMGEVYRARDTKLNRDVAIKTLPSALGQEPDRLARFDREAKLLAALNHAHIAAIYGLDEHAGTQFLAMELIEGRTLAEQLIGGALPVEDALRIALQIAEALEAAHGKGVVHRDLKPANVMITRDGQVKVLDFGLAKAFSGDPNQAVAAHSPALSAAMTQQGMILGTAGYMSPEQASGQATDQRADVWSFGVVLYEMLTGMPLFAGESVPHILADVLRTEPDWRRLPKRLDPRVKRLLERCLRKKMRDRYHSMADVRVEVEDILREPDGGAVVATSARPLWRRALPAAVTLALGGLLASAYFVGLRPAAAPLESVPRPAVSRFVITPPATAPLAATGGMDVAVSPDGQRIAYLATDPDSGNVEIHVRELDALEARSIGGTERPPTGPLNPFFSPDGKSVGFQSERGIVSAAVDGRPSVKMLDRPSPGFAGAWWSADNTLVYSSGTALWRVSAGGGGTPERVLQRESGIAAAPVLLPGGRAVLFHAYGDEAGDRVAVLDLATGEEKTVVDGGSNPTYVETGHVVFARGDTLMAVPFEAAELAVTGEPVALVQGIRRTAAADYALSASGTLVYVPGSAANATPTAVVWVDRAGTVTGRAVPELVDNPRDPRLSPDGTRLLLVTGLDADGDLWSYDLRGRPPTPLALADENRFPAWSPDGSQVAFLMSPSFQLVTLPADGSVRVPRVVGTRIGAPDVWSATGELLVTGGAGVADIRAVPVDGTGEPRDVVASESNEFDAALSPNGRWLAYVSDRTGRGEIWVQEYPEGVVPMRVSSNGGHEPQWSADGRELFYRQGPAMMAVAVETSAELPFAAPAQLFSGPYVQRVGPGSRGYAVAGDGRFLMILPPEDPSGTAAPASIVVVQNFTTELEQRVRPSGR